MKPIAGSHLASLAPEEQIDAGEGEKQADRLARPVAFLPDREGENVGEERIRGDQERRRPRGNLSLPPVQEEVVAGNHQKAHQDDPDRVLDQHAPVVSRLGEEAPDGAEGADGGESNEKEIEGADASPQPGNRVKRVRPDDEETDEYEDPDCMVPVDVRGRPRSLERTGRADRARDSRLAGDLGSAGFLQPVGGGVSGRPVPASG